MNKKSLGVIGIALVLVGTGLTFHLLTKKTAENRESHITHDQTNILDVDNVVNDPDKFTGLIGVEGSITRINEPGLMFTLGCEDACVLMPVKYTGHVPAVGTSIIAYGEIKKTEESKYIFVAQEIAAK